MINVIVIIGILLLPLIGIRLGGGNPLSLDQSNIIKGLAALLLVCVHIGNSLPIPGAYSVISAFGYLLVSIFFFYSGYGTFLGIDKRRKQGVRGEIYVAKQALKLIKLMVIVELLYFLVFAIYDHTDITLLNLLACLSGMKMLAGQMWYVLACIIIDLAICLFALLDRNKKYSFIHYTIAGVLLYATYIIARGRPFHELQSCIAYLIGALVITFPGFRDRIISSSASIQNKRILISLFVFAFSNIVIYGTRHFYGDLFILRVIFGWVSVASFLVMLLNTFSKCQISNKILIFSGGLFAEIYFLHQIVINVLDWQFPTLFSYNSIIVSIIVFAITIAISYIISYLRKSKV